jgi:branched-chain amino acid aminotransferase
LEIKQTTSPLKKPDFNQPVPFGVHHTDHLFEVDYAPTNGWGKPIISPYHHLLIDPANSALHYAIQLFEGMKAYRNVNNPEEIMLFRPEMNMKRMIVSAQRLGLPVNNFFKVRALMENN